MSKIMLDQVIMSPIGTCLFYMVTSALQGEVQQVPSKLKEKFVPTLVASYTLWPAAHAINFKFVPSQQRILYTNVVSVSLLFLCADMKVPGPLQLHICNNCSSVVGHGSALVSAINTPLLYEMP